MPFGLMVDHHPGASVCSYRRRDPRLQDRSRQVVTTCGLGNLAAMGARLLKEMGFTNVPYMEGGMQAWKDAGLPTD